MRTFIKNLKEMPFKVSRFIGMAVGVLAINNPLYLLQDTGQAPGMIIAAVIGLVVAHLDHEMLDERSMKDLWKGMLLSAIIILPVSIVQGFTVGYLILLLLALFLGPMMVSLWYDLKDAHKRKVELGGESGYLLYNDYRICGPILLIITIGLGLLSKGEPLVVVVFWGWFIWYTMWSLNEDLENTKSWCSRTIDQRSVVEIHEEDYRD